MRTASEGARKSAPPKKPVPAARASEALINNVVEWLDDAKAEEVITIDLAGKSSIGDFMVIASGRSDRHVVAISEQVQAKLKEAGCPEVRVEGKSSGDWVVIDTGDIILHIFRPEVREFYNLEKMWLADRPADPTSSH